jgi:hypothetical protein
MRYEVHVGYHKYLIINYQVLNARIWMDDLGIFETSGCDWNRAQNLR